jgi:hypothetical protein
MQTNAAAQTGALQGQLSSLPPAPDQLGLILVDPSLLQTVSGIVGELSTGSHAILVVAILISGDPSHAERLAL